MHQRRGPRGRRVVRAPLALADAAYLGDAFARRLRPKRRRAEGRSRPSLRLGAPKIDACQVLTKDEIETVQGDSVEEIKASVPQSNGMLISQCLFRTATFANSVSVTVGAPDPGKPTALTPREFWRQQFHPLEAQEEKGRGGGKALWNSTTEREEERKPRLIGGLGDEAYWVDNPIAGALYILRGETYARISIGGVRAESARLEKTKALGRAVVKRLRSATASSRSSPDAAVSH